MKHLLKIVALKDKETLASVRNLPGLQAAIHNQEIWIMGIVVAEKEDPATAQIPSIHNYVIGNDGLLFPIGGKTPVGRLPELTWKTIKELLSIEMPVAAYAGKLPQPYEIALVASEDAKEVYATLLPLHDWLKASQTLPEARLREIQFALSVRNEVLVLNSPLTPVRGQHFWRSGQCLIPLGFGFEPPLLALLLEEKLEIGEDTLLLFDTVGGYQVVPNENFIPGSRVAINLLSAQTERDGGF